MAVYYPQCLAAIQVIFDGFGSQEPTDPTIWDVRPRAVSVHLNGYREADSFEMEFDAAGFPFSPELIRNMGVSIYLYQTDNVQANSRPSEDDLVVAGLVDDAHYSAGSDGRIFRVSGRDYTSLLIDKQWPADKKFPVGKPLNVIVQDLIDEATHQSPSRRVIKVTVVDGTTISQVGKQSIKSDLLLTGGQYKISKKGQITIPHSGDRKVHTNKKGIPQKAGSSYWDVIYRACIQYGLIAFIRGAEVIISTPQTLTEATLGRLRSVAYGKDLATLDINRKLGRETVPTIVARSYDPKTMSSIEAKYPANDRVKTTAIGTKKDEFRVVVVNGVTDRGILLQFAKSYYENLARSEATVEFSTRDLKDLNDNNLLHLRPGDPVQISFDSIIAEDFHNLPAEKRYSKLRELGYANDIALLISNEYDRINQFRSPFYTKDINFNWDITGGLGLSVTAINFISVKRDGDDANAP